MEEPLSPPEPGSPPEAPPPSAAAPTPGDAPAPMTVSPPRTPLPDLKGALPIPDHFRLPFRGKMATPTSVPSATQRRVNLNLIRQRRQRRGFLSGLLFGQLLIIGLDRGGDWYLSHHPEVRIQHSLCVASVVFLGMAVGAAVLCLGVSVIYAAQGLRALGRRPRPVQSGLGVGKVLLTLVVLGATMGVILGTAWFMIPQDRWKPTVEFARRQGAAGLEASRSRLRAWFPPKTAP